MKVLSKRLILLHQRSVNSDQGTKIFELYDVKKVIVKKMEYIIINKNFKKLLSSII